MERVIVPSSELTWGYRILYGIGGFLAANVLCNIWAYLCEAVFMALEAYTFGLFVMLGGIVIILRWLWHNVKHQPTRTGIIVCIAWNVFVGVAMLQGL